MNITNTSPNQTRDVFSVDGACEFLHICRETFYGEMRAGRLKTFRIKSRRLVTRAALLRYIADREAEENAA